jgi:5-methylcytosine-specific restriction endonuclease McrA
MIPAFPKPSQHRAVPKFLCDDGVFRFPDGREICDQKSKKGRDEYHRRKRKAWEDQRGICAICHLQLNWGDTTNDHIKPRKSGGSERDDRQENLAAVHWKCNIERGSKRSGFYDVP